MNKGFIFNWFHDTIEGPILSLSKLNYGSPKIESGSWIGLDGKLITSSQHWNEFHHDIL